MSSDQPHRCRLEDFTDYPKKYKRMNDLTLQNIMINELEHHEQNESRLRKLIKLLEYKIQNHHLPQCKICFTDLEALRNQGRKVSKFCSTKCRVEADKRKKQVFPAQVKVFGGKDPIIIWSEKKERGYALPSYRQDIQYTSTIDDKRVTHKIGVKKGKKSKKATDSNI